MNKPELRKLLRALLAALAPEDIQQRSRKISARLLASDWWRQAEIVFAFCSMPGEVETHALIQTALAQGKVVGLPRIAGADLVFHHLTRIDQQFVEHSYGMREPAANWPVLNPCDLAGQTLLVVTPGWHTAVRNIVWGGGKAFMTAFLHRSPPAAV